MLEATRARKSRADSSDQGKRFARKSKREWRGTTPLGFIFDAKSHVEQSSWAAVGMTTLWFANIALTRLKCSLLGSTMGWAYVKSLYQKMQCLFGFERATTKNSSYHWLE